MKTNYSTRRGWIDLIQDTTRPNAYKIAMIYTAVSARREGLATDLLREVCADADREGATLTLAVVPEQTGGKAPNVPQLMDWYAKHGFVEISSHIGWPRMIRLPQPARIPNFPIMRVVESDGAVSWLDGHNEQDAFETFGPDISIAFMWGRVK